MRKCSSDLSRFESKIAKSECGCWIWVGCFFKDENKRPRYGAFAARQADGSLKQVKANRQAWRYFRNEEPGEKQVLHTCDNKSCVNPDHLYLGTHQQNMKDSRERGTHRSGARHFNCKKSEAGLLERIKDLRRARIPVLEICTYLNIGMTSYYRWKNAGVL